MAPREQRRLDEVLPGLLAAREPFPFSDGMEIRSFLLERAEGNLLVYGIGALASYGRALAHRGGVVCHYLNHQHEAGVMREQLPGVLAIHEADRQEAERSVRVDAAFATRHRVDADFEVIPTPGHTPGATAFLWETKSARILFTGDTIYLSRGEWVAALLETSDRDAYLASLALLRRLRFDVLVPWLATAGHPPYALTDRADASRRIGAIIDRLERGEGR